MAIKESLSVSIIQPDTYWESPEANRAELEEMIADLPESPDLIVLPEMFTTGFSTNPQDFSEPMNFTTHRWMRQIAAQYQTAICGSFMVKEKSIYFNRLLFVYPNGDTSHYDKKHLFGFGGEAEFFSSGNERLIVTYKGWKICPLICYDLRFPVFSRNTNLAYDILIYSASWPAGRTHVWDILLKARALENQSYVIGANRIGTDGNHIAYSGGSLAVDPKGMVLADLQSNQTSSSLHLSKNELDSFRKKFPAHLDADEFRLL
jgi:omega-amidase